jgi:hypothetical protein
MPSIDDILKQIDDMTPDKGFNLCGLDDYGKPDEQGLYLIGNFASEEEANAELEKRQKENPDERFFVYGADEPEPPSPVKAFMAGQPE